MSIRMRGVWAGIAGLWLVSAAITGAFTSSKGYQITSPAGWKTDKTGLMGSDVFFFAKPENGFAANLNVVVVPSGAGETLESGKSQLKALLSKSLSGYRQLSQGYTQVGGVRGLDTLSAYKMGTPQKPMRMRQVIALRNGKAFTFTCTSLASNHANYDKAFNDALKSIRWNK